MNALLRRSATDLADAIRRREISSRQVVDAHLSQAARVNPDLNAVVLNIGKSQGVKEGMPFRVYRDETEIGTVKVVLAREMVSAALVESVQQGITMKIGDRVEVDAQ